MPKSNDTFKDAIKVVALTKELEKAKEEILRLNAELIKLQSNPTPVVENSSDISDEEDIALRELRKLQNKSKSGQELSLEEVKKYDILVKNKRQVQSGDAPDESKDLPLGIDEDNLLILANAKTEKK